MARIALVTCREWPTLTSDDRLLLAPLAQLGIDAEPAVWDDAGIDWADYDGVVLRSTWDYHKRITDFDEWLVQLAECGAKVWNPTTVLRWNSDKRYLLELSKRDVPIVPTSIISRDRVVDLSHLLRSNGWSKAVVKPTIAATAYRTWLTEPATAERDQRQLMTMMLHSDVMVQPFMQEVVREGEYSFVFFNSLYSHCFLKRPKSGDYRTQSDFGGRSARFNAPDEWIDQAQDMLEKLPQSMLFARVDCIVQNDKLRLMELELIEPDLGLRYAPEAPAHFARAIAQVLRRGIAAPSSRGLLGRGDASSL